jgi:hypothetical protein
LIEYAKQRMSMCLGNARYSATERRQFADRPDLSAAGLGRHVLLGWGAYGV